MFVVAVASRRSIRIVLWRDAAATMRLEFRFVIRQKTDAGQFTILATHKELSFLINREWTRMNANRFCHQRLFASIRGLNLGGVDSGLTLDDRQSHEQVLEIKRNHFGIRGKNKGVFFTFAIWGDRSFESSIRESGETNPRMRIPVFNAAR